MRSINAQQNLSSEMMAAVDAGRSDDVVGAMVASQKADLSFSMLLQVRNKAGEPVLVMSEKAYKALRKDQFEELNSRTKMVRADLRTIELHGGGSARCMLAEIFR